MLCDDNNKVKREKTPILLVLQPSWWTDGGWVSSPAHMAGFLRVRFKRHWVWLRFVSKPCYLLWSSTHFPLDILGLSYVWDFPYTWSNLYILYQMPSHSRVTSSSSLQADHPAIRAPPVWYLSLYFKSLVCIIDWYWHIFISFSADYKVSGSRVYI